MYKIGTVAEAKKLIGKVPKEVYLEALRFVGILDETYGKSRNVDKDDGGLVFIAENRKDLEYFSSRYFDLKNDFHESIHAVPTEKTLYLNLFFICNNEYGINLFIPASLAPEISLKQE